MDRTELFTDLLASYLEEGYRPTAEELAESACEILFDRGEITEGELDLAFHQLTQEVSYLLARA